MWQPLPIYEQHAIFVHGQLVHTTVTHTHTLTPPSHTQTHTLK